MAIRVASTALVPILRHHLIRSLNSAAGVRPLDLDQKADSISPDPRAPVSSPLSLDDDTSRLFDSYSVAKLLRSLAILRTAASEPLVDFGIWAMRSRLAAMPVLRDVLLRGMRWSFFEHFCGGETSTEACRTILELKGAGLRGMLVYGAEDNDNSEICDRNLQGFLRNVEVAKSLPPSSVSFIIVKITAICTTGLLERVSDLLRWEQKHPSGLKLPWKRETLPIFSPSSPLYHTTDKPEPLSPQEEYQLQLAHHRLEKLCQACYQANVSLAVDAEYTSIQPAIDYFTYSAALDYNTDETNPVVYGTIQAYLKDAKARLVLATEAAERMGISLGIKLVRGAYMSSEERLASSLGFPSPIHKRIEDTHDCYNDCASFMLQKVANGDGAAVVFATHNLQSGKLAAEKAYELGIKSQNPNLQFAQLYGMSDVLSFGLKNAGFVVSKYLPFGPIDMVMPYLLRRAEENRGVLSSSTLDRELMRIELKRRLRAALLWN